MQLSNILSVFASALVLVGYVSAVSVGPYGKKGKCFDDNAQGCSERSQQNTQDNIAAAVEGVPIPKKINPFYTGP